MSFHKKNTQEEVEGRNFSKVTICFYGETPGDTYRQLDGDTRGDFRIHRKEVVVHAGIDDFHRRLVAGVSVTATHASAILTINREKKHEISLSVSSKDKKREILLAVSSKDKKREILLEVNSKESKYRLTLFGTMLRYSFVLDVKDNY